MGKEQDQAMEAKGINMNVKIKKIDFHPHYRGISVVNRCGKIPLSKLLYIQTSWPMQYVNICGHLKRVSASFKKKKEIRNC